MPKHLFTVPSGSALPGTPSTYPTGYPFLLTGAGGAVHYNVNNRWRAPFTWVGRIVAGNAVVANNVWKPGLLIPVQTNLTSIKVYCEVAPSGAPVTVSLKKNGVLIANIDIDSGAKLGQNVTINQELAAGDLITFDITSVGSAVAGSDIGIQLICN